MVAVTSSPTFRPSVLRTESFTTRTKDPDFESGKIAVFQIVSPMVAVTFSGVKPLAEALKKRISSAASLGKLRKCHAPLPWYIHSFAVKVKLRSCKINGFHNVLITPAVSYAL